jgi:hypothetical protein
MELMVLILNDEVKCLHVVIQRTHKLVMMGHINYKDHALIKRWQVGKKKCEGQEVQGWKKWGYRQKLFLFVARGCECFWSFGVHNNMSVEIVIEKLQKITKESSKTTY